MEDIVFTKEQKREYQRCLQKVFPSPYIICVRNENGNLRHVNLFDNKYYDAQVSLNSGTPGVSYTDVCMAFFNKVEIGMFLVKIIEPTLPDNLEILTYMKFEFKRKDARGNCTMMPLDLYDDPLLPPQPILFKAIDFQMDNLSSLNFSLPPKAELELHLFQKKHSPNA